jgi:hypothetical protein
MNTNVEKEINNDSDIEVICVSKPKMKKQLSNEMKIPKEFIKISRFKQMVKKGIELS